MKILASTFQKFELHKTYKLNSGGCGFFALKVYDTFKPIIPQLRLINIQDYFFNDYFHVVLEHRGFRFDSEGEATKWTKYPSEFVAYKQLLFDINARDTWNDLFDRKHVPTIEAMIKDVYNRYQHQIAYDLNLPGIAVLPSRRKIIIHG